MLGFCWYKMFHRLPLPRGTMESGWRRWCSWHCWVDEAFEQVPGQTPRAEEPTAVRPRQPSLSKRRGPAAVWERSGLTVNRAGGSDSGEEMATRCLRWTARPNSLEPVCGEGSRAGGTVSCSRVGVRPRGGGKGTGSRFRAAARSACARAGCAVECDGRAGASWQCGGLL